MDQIDKWITLAFALTALFISLIQHRRSRRISNEDVIFKEKLNIYKNLSKKAAIYIEQTYSVIEWQQDYEGTKEEWIEEGARKNFEKYMVSVNEFDAELLEYSPILPEPYIRKAQELNEKMTRLLVNSYHFDNLILFETYDQLIDLQNELINLSREDLHVDILQNSLKKRLKK